jgi:class 3 adenylate cyclase/tetratricopeptide (TPR) repeat protein
MGDTPRSTANDTSGPIFGDVLRQLRRAASLTQEELAARANLSPRGLSDLERGVNRHPRRETLLALAAAFDLSEQERDRLFAAARRRALRAPTADAPMSDLLPSALAVTMSASPTLNTHATALEQTADIQNFLIADVRGYSTYTYEHRDEDAAALAIRFAGVGREVVEAHGGRVVELRGDEVMAVFASARAALRAAVELQQRLDELALADPENLIRCGVGLEAGEAVVVEDGYRGQALNLAARLCSRAAPGEVLAGETIIALARRVAGLVFRDRGLATLKGFANPVRVIQVLPEEEQALPIEQEQEQGPINEPHLPVGNFLWARPEHRLVAREREMRTLLAELDAVQEGAGRVVFLVGEPGVGKTRLAQEVTEEARDRGFFVVTGRCYAPQENVPYFPFLEALAHAYAVAPTAVRATLPQQWPEVARLVPDRTVGAPVAGEGPMSGSTVDQQRLFWHVTGFLQALSAVRPLALLLDDLHWIDGASLALLLHLARHTRESAILLLGTYRDVDVPSTHPLARAAFEVGKEHLMERIEVHRLSLEGTAALLGATLEGGEVAEAVAALIYGPTEGNAFFAQESLRALVERGEVTLLDGRWELREGVELVVPENVRAAVLERVARLSSVTQQALALASVLGQTFTFDDLLATGGHLAQTESETTDGERGETALEAALEEAVEARVLREAGGETYTFSHALAQRALAEKLRARRRRRMHLAAAEAIAGLSERQRLRRAAEIAYHFLHAEEGARALPFALLAGDQAQAVYANAESEGHYCMAARLAQEVGDRRREGEAYKRLGSLYFWNVGDYALALTALEQAAAAQRMSPAGALDGETAALLARCYARSSQVGKGLELLMPWLDAEGRLDAKAEPLIVQAAQFTALADIYFHLTITRAGHYEAQLGAAEHAAEVWRTIGDTRFLSDALLLRGIALRLLGHWEEGLRQLQEVVELAREAGPLYVSGHASYHVGHSFLQSGQWDQAVTAIDLGIDLSRRSGTISFYSSALFVRGLAAFYGGEWGTAGRLFQDAATSFERLRLNSISAYGPLGLGIIQAATGDTEPGLRHLHEAVARVESTGFAFLAHRAQRETAEVELALGQFAAARARLESIVAAPGCQTYNDITPMPPLLAWALLEMGEETQAEALLDRAAPQAEAQRHWLALLDVQRVRALLYTKQGRYLQAEEALDDGLARARAMPHPYAEIKLLYACGKLEAARVCPDAARQRFAASLAICATLGERLYAERIGRDLEALG